MADIIPLHRGARPIPRRDLNAIFDIPDHANEIAPYQPPFGERLVAFVRRWQFRFFIGCYVIAAGSLAYFAFQLGRGATL